MKNLILLSITILFFSCSNDKSFSTDLEKIGLTGKVNRIKFYHEGNNKEKEDENSYSIDNELYFNKNGMISEQRQYSSEGLINIYSFRYDDKSLLISKNHYNGSKEFLTKSKFENVLNSKGKLMKQSEFRALGNPPIDSTNIKFNVFPEKITEFLYDMTGNLIQYNVYDLSSSFMKDVTVLNNGGIVRNSIVNITDEEVFIETNYECVEHDTRKNCIKYKIIETDSTESYINAKIDYYK